MPQCVPSIEEALLAQALPKGGVAVTVEEGADMSDPSCGFAVGGGRKCSDAGIASAAQLAASDQTDVVILALGNSEWQNGWTAHENKDRHEIGLPGQQPELVSAVLNSTKGKGKPIIAVLVNGGLVSLDSLVAVPPQRQKLAIVEALLPGNTGATALANALWGRTNTFGSE